MEDTECHDEQGAEAKDLGSWRKPVPYIGHFNKLPLQAQWVE